MNEITFNKADNGVLINDKFIYRVNPYDYISLTKEILVKPGLFSEIEKISDESGAGSLQDEQAGNILSRYAGLLSRYKDIHAYDDPAMKHELVNDFRTYRYFYKEIGASLKFNPLSKSDAGRHVLEKILIFLQDYIELITPKALYKVVDTLPHPGGLLVAGTDIRFENRKLVIFNSHSTLNGSKEIDSEELLNRNVVVYVVTIGAGIDDKVKDMMARGEMFDAYLLNGIGAGAAEMAANDLNRYMNDSNADQRFEYKRLSPGYGDWNVSDQAKIFKLLDPEKHIGVKLTDSHIMLPEKSTSGIMGLTLRENQI